MPKISAVATDQTIQIPAGDGESLTVTVKTARLTPDFLAKLEGAERDGSLAGSLLAPLSEMITSWNLEDDSGRPIAITPKGLGGVPVPILLHIMNAVASHLAASSTNGRH